MPDAPTHPADGIVDSVLDLVGRTPLLRLGRASPPGGAEICAKLELFNPSGSVKDRPALAMIQAAQREGTLAPGATIVEATSGNTGISLAMVAAVAGYRCIVVMPEDMASARHVLVRSYGAQLVLTPTAAGMRGAVEEAERLVRTIPGAFMARQFENPANPEAHAVATGEEIWRATAGELAAFVAGVGTGGTLTGVARTLKARRQDIQVVAVEPRSSAVLSGGAPGAHGLAGLGAGFVPPVLDRALLDEVVCVSDLDADEMSKRLAREEGILVGPSSGANVYAALQVARRLRPGQRVVTVLCDTGMRYAA